MQFGIKYRVLLLSLVPTITISVLLVTYFVNTRLQDLEDAFRAHGERIALKLEKELNDTHSDLGQIENLSGWLKLELETKSIKLREYQILAKAILIFLFGLSISALLAYRMGRNLSHPILEMGKVVNKIREGALNTRTQVSSYPELKMLGSGINAMAETLENAHNELQHKINQATLSLRRTLETIEVQNIELEMSRRAAEHANKIKSEFLADMSHEIRTPLNGVVGFVNLLQKTELNPKQQEYIRTIQKSANNLLAILNDILDFSKMEAGKLRIERSIMDVRECIDEILNLLLPHAQEKNIALIPLIYSDVPAQVLGDPLRIKQIVTNLVSNAIKFTERGSVIVRVMLENESFPHTTLRVNVTDTGIGLSPEEQKVLFHAFNQTKSAHKSGGTGLGLVISKKLVEQMGGTIGVESEPQQGSTFWFTFQVESTPQVEFTAQVEPTLETQPALTSSTLSSFVPSLDVLEPPVNVLAVDDNPENLKLIRILLEDMGIEVTTTDNGKAAIVAVRQKTFDLILLDIRMPNMTGLEAAHIIRNVEAEYHRKPTPIIALTANALAAEKESLFKNDINDYLAKPIGEIELKNILKKWIQSETNVCTIDWALGKQLAGGRVELAQEFFEKLREILPLEKQRINDDYQKRNWQAFSDRIHKLHGACCYCGVPELKSCVQTLEAAAVSCLPDIIKPHLEAFNLAVDAVLTATENTTIHDT
ncbi:MAG TPA: ATP-binding protein [Gammaproteobacteria bacterium]|nr:ATP-binding protein [Gammaproteobacteria bacterium]